MDVIVCATRTLLKKIRAIFTAQPARRTNQIWIWTPGSGGLPDLVALLKRIWVNWFHHPERSYQNKSDRRTVKIKVGQLVFGWYRARRVEETSQKSWTARRNLHHQRFIYSFRRRWTKETRTIDLPQYLLRQSAERAKYLELKGANCRKSAYASGIYKNIQEEPEMLAASFCCEIYYTVLPSTTMASQVPRCLFGKPDPRETMEMFQEALDAERSKFAKRWGVNPSEDKENNYQRRNNEKSEPSTNKKRSNPYSRQTSIHGEQHFSRKISTWILSMNLTEIRRIFAMRIFEICTREHEYKAYSVNILLWMGMFT